MTEDEMVGWHHRLNGHEFDLGTFSPDCPESLTPGAYTSGGILSSVVVLYRPVRESGEV